MTTKEFMLAEFDQEMAVSRKLMERTPLAESDWKPHSRSMDLGNLAAHIAEIPTWAMIICGAPSFTLGGSRPPRPRYETAADLVAVFDRNAGAARAAIAAVPDADLQSEWTLLRGESVLARAPKAAALRRLVLSHMIHHRGQLSVYLRLKDVPLPPMYGPTADEAGF